MRSASRPTPPWDGSSGVSTIYNAMVAPLGPLGVKGVAWYQGEADVGTGGLRPPSWRMDGELAHAVPRSPAPVPDRRARRLGQAGLAPGRKRVGRADRRAEAGGDKGRERRAGERHRSRRAERHPSREQAGGRPAARACGAPARLSGRRDHRSAAGRRGSRGQRRRRRPSPRSCRC